MPIHTPEDTAEVVLQSTKTPEPSPTVTPQPEQTKTTTLTQTSTDAPVWATVRADTGAVIREGPGYEYLIVTYAQDGSLIQLLPETSLSGTTLWVKVIAENGNEGWILHALLIIPTPTNQP